MSKVNIILFGYTLGKKEKSFELFEKGLSPSSPEVKALGLKAQTRANYYHLWKQAGGSISQASTGGESIGGIDESRAPIPTEAKDPPTEEVMEANPEEEPPVGESNLEEDPLAGESKIGQGEAIGAVSEAAKEKGKDGKPGGPEKKLATTIAEDGIKCTVFLNLQTLALFRIAASTQAQLNGGEPLLLGDFLDTCAEDYFLGRGKKLGLMPVGGKS